MGSNQLQEEEDQISLERDPKIDNRAKITQKNTSNKQNPAKNGIHQKSQKRKFLSLLTLIMTYIQEASSKRSLVRHNYFDFGSLTALSNDKVVIDNTLLNPNNETQKLIMGASNDHPAIEFLNSTTLMYTNQLNLKFKNLEFVSSLSPNYLGMVTDGNVLNVLKMDRDGFRVVQAGSITIEISRLNVSSPELYKCVDIEGDISLNRIWLVFQKFPEENSQKLKKAEKSGKEGLGQTDAPVILVQTQFENISESTPYLLRALQLTTPEIDPTLRFNIIQAPGVFLDNTTHRVSKTSYLAIFQPDVYGQLATKGNEIKFFIAEVSSQNLDYLNVRTVEHDIPNVIFRNIIYGSAANQFRVLFTYMNDVRKISQLTYRYNQSTQAWGFVGEVTAFHQMKASSRANGVFRTRTKSPLRLNRTLNLLDGVLIHEWGLESDETLVIFMPIIPANASEITKEIALPPKVYWAPYLPMSPLWNLDGWMLRNQINQFTFFAAKKIEKTQKKENFEKVGGLEDGGGAGEVLFDIYGPMVGNKRIRRAYAFSHYQSFLIFNNQSQIKAYVNHQSLMVIDLSKITNETGPVENIKLWFQDAEMNITSQIITFKHFFEIIQDPLQPLLQKFDLEIMPERYHRPNVLNYAEVDKTVAWNLKSLSLGFDGEAIQFNKIQLEGIRYISTPYQIFKTSLFHKIAIACNNQGSEMLENGESGGEMPSEYTLNCKIFFFKFSVNNQLNFQLRPKTTSKFNLTHYTGEIDYSHFGCGKRYLKKYNVTRSGYREQNITKTPYITHFYSCLFVVGNTNLSLASAFNFRLDEVRTLINTTDSGIKTDRFQDVKSVSVIQENLDMVNRVIPNLNLPEFNITSNLLICEKFGCLSTLHDYNSQLEFFDDSENFCPQRILGVPYSLKQEVHASILSQCSEQDSPGIYIHNQLIQLPGGFDQTNLDLFCARRNYFVFFNNKTKKLQIGLPNIDTVRFSESSLFTRELGFVEIKKLYCLDYLVVIGTAEVNSTQKSKQGQNGRSEGYNNLKQTTRRSVAASFDINLLFHDKKTQDRASESFIRKDGILLDFIEMEDSHTEFDISNAMFNYSLMTDFEYDMREVFIIVAKSEGGSRKIYCLKKNKKAAELAYASFLTREEDESESAKIQVWSAVNGVKINKTRLTSFKSTKGNFYVGNVTQIRKSLVKDQNIPISEILDIQGSDYVYSYWITTQGSEINDADKSTFTLADGLPQPFRDFISRNFYDSEALKLTRHGFAVQFSNVTEVGAPDSGKYTIRLRIYDFGDQSNPVVSDALVPAELGQWLGLRLDMKVDVRSFVYDPKNEIYLLGIDFRTVGYDGYGMGKGDFNVEDMYEIYMRKILSEGENSENSGLDNSEFFEQRNGVNDRYSIGVMVQRGGGSGNIVALGYYGPDFRMQNSALLEAGNQFSGKTLANLVPGRQFGEVMYSRFMLIERNGGIPSLSYGTFRFTKSLEGALTAKLFSFKNTTYAVYVACSDPTLLKLAEISPEASEPKSILFTINLRLQDSYIIRNLTCEAYTSTSSSSVKYKDFLGHCVALHQGRTAVHFKIPKVDQNEPEVSIESVKLAYPRPRVSVIQERNYYLTDNYYVEYRRDQNRAERGFVDCIVWELSGPYVGERRPVRNYRFSLTEETDRAHVYSGVFEDADSVLFFQVNNVIKKLQFGAALGAEDKVGKGGEEVSEAGDGLGGVRRGDDRSKNAKKLEFGEKEILRDLGQNQPHGFSIDSQLGQPTTPAQFLHLSNGRKTLKYNIAQDLIIAPQPNLQKFLAVYILIQVSIIILFCYILMYGSLNFYTVLKKERENGWKSLTIGNLNRSRMDSQASFFLEESEKEMTHVSGNGNGYKKRYEGDEDENGHNTSSSRLARENALSFFSNNGFAEDEDGGRGGRKRARNGSGASGGGRSRGESVESDRPSVDFDNFDTEAEVQMKQLESDVVYDESEFDGGSERFLKI